MSETVLLGMLQASSAIIVAIIGVWAIRTGKIRKDVAIIKGEVKNSHSTNLREEQDERHRDQMAALAIINEKLNVLDRRDLARAQDIQQINSEVNDLRGDVQDHIRWSHQYTRRQEASHQKLNEHVKDLETTLTERKEE